VSGHHDHGGYVEGPIPGLPGPLPEGENLLWQGSPDWRRLALEALHLRFVMIWFAVLLLWAAVSGSGASGIMGTLAAAGAAVGLIAFLAWAMARSTIYSITSRRVVLRYGVALPKCINVPFTLIEEAGLRRFRDGTGDLPLQLCLRKGDRLGWAMLWPHARPWKISRPQPMLRAVPDADQVASLLSRALLAAKPEGRRPGMVGESTAGDLPQAQGAVA
jgi:hypothetical protein